MNSKERIYEIAAPCIKPVPGFTLIELLTIIGIISIMAALLLPALAQAGAREQAISCLSKVVCVKFSKLDDMVITRTRVGWH